MKEYLASVYKWTINKNWEWVLWGISIWHNHVNWNKLSVLLVLAQAFVQSRFVGAWSIANGMHGLKNLALNQLKSVKSPYGWQCSATLGGRWRFTRFEQLTSYPTAASTNSGFGMPRSGGSFLSLTGILASRWFDISSRPDPTAMMSLDHSTSPPLPRTIRLAGIMTVYGKSFIHRY